MPRITVVDDVGNQAYLDVDYPSMTVEQLVDDLQIIPLIDGTYRMGPRWGFPPVAIDPFLDL